MKIVDHRKPLEVRLFKELQSGDLFYFPEEKHDVCLVVYSDSRKVDYKFVRLSDCCSFVASPIAPVVRMQGELNIWDAGEEL